MGGGSSVMGMIALRGLAVGLRRLGGQGARNWGWRDVLPYFRGIDPRSRPAGAGAERAAVPTSSIACRGKNGRSTCSASRPQFSPAGCKSHADIYETAEDGFFATPLSQDSERATSARCYLTNEVRARPNLAIMTNTRVRRLRIDGNRVVWRRRRARRRNQVAVGGRGGPLRGRDQLGGNPAALGHRSGGRAAAARDRAGRGPSRRRPQLSEPLAPAFRPDARSAIAPCAWRPALHHDEPAVFLGARRMPGGRSVPLFRRARQRPHVRDRHGHDRGRALRSVLARLRDAALARSRCAARGFAAPADRPARCKAHGHRHTLRRAADLRATVKGCFREAYLLPRDPPLRLINGTGALGALKALAATAVLVRRRRCAAPSSIAPSGPAASSPTGTATQPLSEAEILAASGTMFHPSCTCAIGGEDDPMAVVDPECRVYGVRGLRVADASVMPSVPSANTNIPTIMIAERAADFIRTQGCARRLDRTGPPLPAARAAL